VLRAEQMRAGRMRREQSRGERERGPDLAVAAARRGRGTGAPLRTGAGGQCRPREIRACESS
jgi:hypothetical protein